MKKQYKIFIIIITVLLLLCSCNDIDQPQNIGSSENGILNYTERFVDGETRILFKDGRYLFYYNKLDGGAYTFCFDPLCNHKSDCISRKFESMCRWQSLVYRESDNRFYALRGSKLVSMSFDGSDLKVLYSFNDSDDLTDSYYEPVSPRHLTLVGDYAYMIYRNSDDGLFELFRYHIKTNKMENMMQKNMLFDNVSYYVVSKDNLYFWSHLENGIGFFKSDLDLKNVTRLSDKANEYFATSLLYDNKIYSVPTETIVEDGKTTINSLGIYAYDIESGEETILLELNLGKKAEILSITDRYIYYNVHDPIVVGTHTSAMGATRDVKNEYSKVYRFDINTKQVDVVLEDARCETREMFLTEKLVLIHGTMYDIDGNKNIENTGNCFLVADINENGMFVNLRELEY